MTAYKKYLKEGNLRGIPNYKTNTKCCSNCDYVYHDYEGVVICQNSKYEKLKDWTSDTGIYGIYVDPEGYCSAFKKR
jgi:hypothetical protein